MSIKIICMHEDTYFFCHGNNDVKRVIYTCLHFWAVKTHPLFIRKLSVMCLKFTVVISTTNHSFWAGELLTRAT